MDYMGSISGVWVPIGMIAMIAIAGRIGLALAPKQ